MKDKQILELIKKGDRSKAFESIYKHYPKVHRMIIQKGGTEDDAKDLFQESVIVFYHNVLKVDFILSSAISTYLYSVSYNLWLKKIRDVKSKEAKMSDTIEVVGDANVDMSEEIELDGKMNIIEGVLQKLSTKCFEILKKYYYDKQSMKTIAVEMGYNTDKIAKNQKYKCLQKAREMARQEWDKSSEVYS